MTDRDGSPPERPSDDVGFTDATVAELTDLVAEYVEEGAARSGSGIGIRPDDLHVDANGLVVTVRLGEEVLLEHSFEPESWERVGDSEDSDPPDDVQVDPREVATTLSERLLDEVDLEARLVERRRERLADLLVEPAESGIRSRLAAAAPDVDWDLSVDVVELPYEYRHGDPEWVYETGYPPFGLAVTCFDPDAEVVVEVEPGSAGVAPPGDASATSGAAAAVEPLVDEAVDRLREAVGDG